MPKWVKPSMDAKKLAEGLEIFARYDKGARIEIWHDILYVRPLSYDELLEIMCPGDISALVKNGWVQDRHSWAHGCHLTPPVE